MADFIWFETFSYASSVEVANSKPLSGFCQGSQGAITTTLVTLPLSFTRIFVTQLAV